jgi:hypothetical protein
VRHLLPAMLDAVAVGLPPIDCGGPTSPACLTRRVLPCRTGLGGSRGSLGPTAVERRVGCDAGAQRARLLFLVTRPAEIGRCLSQRGTGAAPSCVPESRTPLADVDACSRLRGAGAGGMVLASMPCLWARAMRLWARAASARGSETTTDAWGGLAAPRRPMPDDPARPITRPPITAPRMLTRTARRTSPVSVDHSAFFPGL